MQMNGTLYKHRGKVHKYLLSKFDTGSCFWCLGIAMSKTYFINKYLGTFPGMFSKCRPLWTFDKEKSKPCKGKMKKPYMSRFELKCWVIYTQVVVILTSVYVFKVGGWGALFVSVVVDQIQTYLLYRYNYPRAECLMVDLCTKLSDGDELEFWDDFMEVFEMLYFRYHMSSFLAKFLEVPERDVIGYALCMMRRIVEERKCSLKRSLEELQEHSLENVEIESVSQK